MARLDGDASSKSGKCNGIGRYSWLLVCCLVVAVAYWARAAKAEPIYPEPPRKKLIQFGWGAPSTAYLRENIREMEKDPFDGVVFGIEGKRDGKTVRGVHVFRRERLQREWFKKAFDDLRQVKFKKFTDNFLLVWSTPGEVDWFSDEDWEIVCNNVGIIAEAAQISGAKGICLDFEPYSPKNMWNYLHGVHSDKKSYTKYAAKARRRGGQFIKAIQAELADPVILTLFQLSYFRAALEKSDLEAAVAKHNYGLIPPFLNGMLDAASPQVKIIDGNERAYGYRTPEPFFRAYHLMRQSALRLIAPENRPKYHNQVLAGQGIYMDSILGLSGGKAQEMSLEQQAESFEECVYLAMLASDEYAWCYSERPRWWLDRNIKPAVIEAIHKARERLTLGESNTLAIEPRRAEISRLTGQAPKIDGQLSDAAWKSALHISNFVQVGTVEPTEARTQAWLTWDADKLYLAFECAEPQMDKLRVFGSGRDDRNWAGDCVEVFISTSAEPQPFYHLVVDTKNQQWDTRSFDSAKSFNANWHSAVGKKPDRWTVEIAIPWQELEMGMPSPGNALRANFCRFRRPRKEISSWSQLEAGFQELRNFGYLIFR